MSNPIADTVDYFSEGGKSSFVRQNNETPPPQPQPESSQKSKRPTTGDGEFDPKQQWLRVLNRIPKRKSSKQYRRSAIMNDSASDQVFELRHRRSSLPDMYSHSFEDDVLPSATEIDQTAREEVVQDYFKKPFGDSAPPPPFLPQEELPESSGDAKHRWGKTLDKVRLIASLQKSKPDEVDKEKVAPMGAELPLYFQPLFDPLFIALSKDEKGNSWVRQKKKG
jgi:hypothetical protein